MVCLNAFSNLLEEVGTTLNLFQQMREGLSQKEWERLADDPLIGPVLDSLADIEYTLES